MVLQGFYRDFLHHNNGSHLGRGVLDDDVWKRCWRRLVAQLASWQATPSGAVGLRFTSILVVEWQGVLDRSWNSERILVFSRVILTKMLGVCRAREIHARINRMMELRGRGLHTGLVVDADSEGAAREGRAAR